jgi:excisionase family DNA binding protein
MARYAASARVVDVEPDVGEVDEARAVAELLASDEPEFELLRTDGMRVTIPRSLLRVMASSASELAEGHWIAVVPGHAELTPNEAARILGVSRPFLVKLLDDDVIPSRRLPRSRHRRVRLEDLVTFQRRRAEKRRGINDIVETARAAGIAY